MLLLTLFFVYSIIISRYLEKRMKTGSVLFSILFFVMLFYVLALSNIQPIDSLFSYLIGVTQYEILKESMNTHIIFLSNKYISSYMAVEFVIVLFSIVIIFGITKKIIKEIKNQKKPIKYHIIKELKHNINFNQVIIQRKIYIKHCKLLH